MAGLRIIPRLDLKGPNLIKGIRLEGLRVVGDPHAFALRYYEQGADELVFMDIVASLYQRNSLSDIIRRAADRVYIPITVGGGIRSIDDVHQALRSGADKVAINTAAVLDPTILTACARKVGAQAVVMALDVRREGNSWGVYTHGGRKPAGLDAVAFAKRAAELGAGEILLTSMDRDGTKDGYDIDLLRAVRDVVPVPIVASGGAGNVQHMADAVIKGGADAVLAASIFHFGDHTIAEAKKLMADRGICVRPG